MTTKKVDNVLRWHHQAKLAIDASMAVGSDHALKGGTAAYVAYEADRRTCLTYTAGKLDINSPFNCNTMSWSIKLCMTDSLHASHVVASPNPQPRQTVRFHRLRRRQSRQDRMIDLVRSDRVSVGAFSKDAFVKGRKEMLLNTLYHAALCDTWRPTRAPDISSRLWTDWSRIDSS